MNIYSATLPVIILSVFTVTLAGCEGDEASAATQDDASAAAQNVTSRQVCQQVNEKIAKELAQVGLGGLGMAYNADGTQVESDESRISRCERNLNAVHNQKDLNYLSTHFIPCFESILKKDDINKTKSCINGIEKNMSPAGGLAFRNYVLLPLLDKADLSIL